MPMSSPFDQEQTPELNRLHVQSPQTEINQTDINQTDIAQTDINQTDINQTVESESAKA